MLRTIINYRINKTENDLGVNMDYVRHIAKNSVPALMQFSKIQGLSDYRKKLPIDVHFVCRLTAAVSSDCGSCVQIEVNLSKNAGLSTDLIRHVLNGQLDKIPAELKKVVTYTRSVMNKEHGNQFLREELIQIYGEEAVMEMGIAMSVAQFFPTLKRALGYSEKCDIIKIDF